jgi:flagellar biosynthetic protein FlhB
VSGGDKASKTEKPTPKKIKDSRKKGQVGKSQEVSAWVTTFAMTLLLPWTISRAETLVLRLVSKQSALIQEPDPAQALRCSARGCAARCSSSRPWRSRSWVLGVAANLAQVGLVPSPEALKPKFERLNPLPGIKRMFGAKTAWMACKELLKLALLAASPTTPSAASSPTCCRPAASRSRAALSGVAAPRSLPALDGRARPGPGRRDYAYERHHLAKELRMSLQEVKDEHKQSDGDPQMKGMVRERQLRMSRNRMMADVATATSCSSTRPTSPSR